jgi:hypothetical protein
MEGLLAFCKWLEQTPMGASVRQSLWLFPAIETIHLLGMATLLATIGAFDLRLMGVALNGQSIFVLGRRLLPCAWAAFAVQVITGFMLFSSEATRMVRNRAFRIKMLLIVLAGLQALVFHFAARRNLPARVEGSRVQDRIAGFVSMILWIAVVAAGRWIGFI